MDASTHRRRRTAGEDSGDQLGDQLGPRQKRRREDAETELDARSPLPPDQRCRGITVLTSDDIFRGGRVGGILAPTAIRIGAAMVCVVFGIINFYSIMNMFATHVENDQNLAACLDIVARLTNKHGDCTHLLHDFGQLVYIAHASGELAVFVMILLPCIWNLTSLLAPHNIPSVGSREQEYGVKAWMKVTRAVSAINLLPRTSGINSLSRFPQFLSGTVQAYEFAMEELKIKKRNGSSDRITRLERICVWCRLCPHVLGDCVPMLLGLLSLHLKMLELNRCSVPFETWRLKEWRAFAAFAITIINCADLKEIQKQEFFLVLFGGDDAVIQSSEQKESDRFQARLMQELVASYGVLRGVAVALTVSACDLQKLFIAEKASEHRPPE